jgi:hypothetical protein
VTLFLAIYFASLKGPILLPMPNWETCLQAVAEVQREFNPIKVICDLPEAIVFGRGVPGPTGPVLSNSPGYGYSDGSLSSSTDNPSGNPCLMDAILADCRRKIPR